MRRIDKERHLRILAARSLSLVEWYTLCSVRYGPVPQELVAINASRDVRGDPRGDASEAECRVALSSCIDRGLLRIMDCGAVAEIENFLRKGRILGPAYGMPEVGDVDFTNSGAEFYREVRRELRGWSIPESRWYVDVYSGKQWVYFPTAALARRAQKELLKAARSADECIAQVHRITDPVPIGPWCVYWWERFPKGYRMQVEFVETSQET